mmetsp:Transcript_57463/g.125867  ORF Transcript_57463/g.125867 Transcript_57463/m.125867 type:complete len:202 (-) Transcript_57463:1779-2384(-)
MIPSLLSIDLQISASLPRQCYQAQSQVGRYCILYPGVYGTARHLRKSLRFSHFCFRLRLLLFWCVVVLVVVVVVAAPSFSAMRGIVGFLIILLLFLLFLLALVVVIVVLLLLHSIGVRTSLALARAAWSIIFHLAFGFDFSFGAPLEGVGLVVVAVVAAVVVVAVVAVVVITAAVATGGGAAAVGVLFLPFPGWEGGRQVR